MPSIGYATVHINFITPQPHLILTGCPTIAFYIPPLTGVMKESVIDSLNINNFHPLSFSHVKGERQFCVSSDSLLRWELNYLVSSIICVHKSVGLREQGYTDSARVEELNSISSFQSHFKSRTNVPDDTAIIPNITFFNIHTECMYCKAVVLFKPQYPIKSIFHPPPLVI